MAMQDGHGGLIFSEDYWDSAGHFDAVAAARLAETGMDPAPLGNWTQVLTPRTPGTGVNACKSPLPRTDQGELTLELRDLRDQLWDAKLELETHKGRSQSSVEDLAKKVSRACDDLASFEERVHGVELGLREGSRATEQVEHRFGQLESQFGNVDDQLAKLGKHRDFVVRVDDTERLAKAATQAAHQAMDKACTAEAELKRLRDRIDGSSFQDKHLLSKVSLQAEASAAEHCSAMRRSLEETIGALERGLRELGEWRKDLQHSADQAVVVAQDAVAKASDTEVRVCNFEKEVSQRLASDVAELQRKLGACSASTERKVQQAAQDARGTAAALQKSLDRGFGDASRRLDALEESASEASGAARSAAEAAGAAGRAADDAAGQCAALVGRLGAVEKAAKERIDDAAARLGAEHRGRADEVERACHRVADEVCQGLGDALARHQLLADDLRQVAESLGVRIDSAAREAQAASEDGRSAACVAQEATGAAREAGAAAQRTAAALAALVAELRGRLDSAADAASLEKLEASILAKVQEARQEETAEAAQGISEELRLSGEALKAVQKEVGPAVESCTDLLRATCERDGLDGKAELKEFVLGREVALKERQSEVERRVNKLEDEAREADLRSRDVESTVSDLRVQLIATRKTWGEEAAGFHVRVQQMHTKLRDVAGQVDGIRGAFSGLMEGFPSSATTSRPPSPKIGMDVGVA